MDFASYSNKPTPATESLRRRLEQRAKEEKRMRVIGVVCRAFVKWGTIVAIVAAVARSVI